MGSAGILSYVKVTAAEAKMLQFIASRSGDIPWNWGDCRPDAAEMIRGIIGKGLLTEVSATAASRGRIRLTDQGRSALAQIDAALQKRTILA